MTPDLSNFIAAQDSGNCYEKALQGIKDGNIGYRWRPLIFPQIYNISMSDREKEFALYSLYEAEVYMCDTTLSKCLHETAKTIVDKYYGHDIIDIFGEINSEKIKSCMALFDIASPYDIFESYRTSGMESELSYIGFELLYKIYEYTQKNCSPEVLEQYVAQFDPQYYFECSPSYDWEIKALKLQYLIEYILGNPNYEGYEIDYSHVLITDLLFKVEYIDLLKKQVKTTSSGRLGEARL